MKIEERERVCLELLRKLPKDRFILIGGYATSSYDLPRFSVDLDIVIRKRDLETFRKIAEAGGYKEVEAGDLEDIYGSSFVRYEKRINDLPVSLDLFIRSVYSRQSGASYSFEYLAKVSQERSVSGFSSAVAVRCKVPNPEMLIALKANSMRLADQRDIIALCNQDIDAAQVARHLKRCAKDIILENLTRFESLLSDEKQKDSIKGVFGLSDKVYDRITRRAAKVIASIRAEMRNKAEGEDDQKD